MSKEQEIKIIDKLLNKKEAKNALENWDEWDYEQRKKVHKMKLKIEMLEMLDNKLKDEKKHREIEKKLDKLYDQVAKIETELERKMLFAMAVADLKIKREKLEE